MLEKVNNIYYLTYYEDLGSFDFIIHKDKCDLYFNLLKKVEDIEKFKKELFEHVITLSLDGYIFLKLQDLYIVLYRKISK